MCFIGTPSVWTITGSKVERMACPMLVSDTLDTDTAVSQHGHLRFCPWQEARARIPRKAVTNTDIRPHFHGCCHPRKSTQGRCPQLRLSSHQRDYGQGRIAHVPKYNRPNDQRVEAQSQLNCLWVQLISISLYMYMLDLLSHTNLY